MGNILDFESLKAKAGSDGSGKNSLVLEDNAEKEYTNEVQMSSKILHS
jgi:hypothetical protein